MPEKAKQKTSSACLFNLDAVITKFEKDEQIRNHEILLTELKAYKEKNDKITNLQLKEIGFPDDYIATLVADSSLKANDEALETVDNSAVSLDGALPAAKTLPTQVLKKNFSFFEINYQGQSITINTRKTGYTTSGSNKFDWDKAKSHIENAFAVAEEKMMKHFQSDRQALLQKLGVEIHTALDGSLEIRKIGGGDVPEDTANKVYEALQAYRNSASTISQLNQDAQDAMPQSAKDGTGIYKDFSISLTYSKTNQSGMKLFNNSSSAAKQNARKQTSAAIKTQGISQARVKTPHVGLVLDASNAALESNDGPNGNTDIANKNKQDSTLNSNKHKNSQTSIKQKENNKVNTQTYNAGRFNDDKDAEKYIKTAQEYIEAFEKANSTKQFPTLKSRSPLLHHMVVNHLKVMSEHRNKMSYHTKKDRENFIKLGEVNKALEDIFNTYNLKNLGYKTSTGKASDWKKKITTEKGPTKNTTSSKLSARSNSYKAKLHDKNQRKTGINSRSATHRHQEISKLNQISMPTSLVDENSSKKESLSPIQEKVFEAIQKANDIIRKNINKQDLSIEEINKAKDELNDLKSKVQAGENFRALSQAGETLAVIQRNVARKGQNPLASLQGKKLGNNARVKSSIESSRNTKLNKS